MKRRDIREIAGSYRRYVWRKWLIMFILLAVVLLIAVISMSVGSSGLSVGQVIKTLFGGGTKQSSAIVWNVRMPRIMTAIAVGFALALAGCIMQNVLRNPLASASTLGVSQGASFGAAFAIICLGAGSQVNSNMSGSAVSITNPYVVTICAFAGGIITTLVILGMARLRRSSPSSMILAGVALSSLFTGGTALIQYFADDVMVASVVYWTFGDLGRAGWNEILFMFILNLGCLMFFMYNRWNYNAIESGVETAKSLGVPVGGLILGSMCLAALISAVSVAMVGCISFIGLIAPHIVRKFVGSDHRFLIPCSGLAGSAVLLAADLVSRTVVSPTILPIGALTSFLGAPLFLYMIFRRGGAKND